MRAGRGRIYGVDVYEGDGDIDWRAVSAAGNSFAIVKVSEGDYMDSRSTPERIAAIRASGMTAGAYVFLRPKSGRSGRVEARTLVERGMDIGLWRRDRQTVRDIRPVLDCEASGYDLGTVAGRRATRVYIRDAVREVVRLTGHRPMIYTGKWWWEQTQEDRLRWTWHDWQCPLWLAAYVSDPAPYLPRGWQRAAMWQYTDRARVDGISQPCDRNVYLGADWHHFTRQLTY
jgi:hypothetical protein